MPDQDKAERIRAEMLRLSGLIDDLDRDWQRLRWSGALIPFTGLVFLISTVGWAILYLFAVGGFFSTALYLIAVRKREYEAEIAQLQLDLSVVEKGVPTPHGAF